MAAAKHLLEVYEPYGFEGVNPAPVSGDGILRGANGYFYYLVRLEHPIESEDIVVEQFLLLPRYLSDPIARVQQSICTVNIARVLPQCRLEPDKVFSYNHVEHWGVGKITPEN